MDAPRTRLYVTGDLKPGNTVPLDAGQAHHVRTVLRLGPGTPVALFNGRDGEVLGHLDQVAKSAVTARLGEVLRPQPAQIRDLVLLFAPIKRAPVDLMVEKATELGVTRLIPVITQRTVVDRVNTERLTAIAIEAAEQCERLTVPAVEEPLALAKALAAWAPAWPLFVAEERSDSVPLGTALANVKAAPGMGVLIGPEGGFARGELDAFSDLPFLNRITLGPRILRAETAALAALAVIQAVAGDWLPPQTT